MSTVTNNPTPRNFDEAMALIATLQQDVKKRDDTIRELRAQLIKRFAGRSERISALDDAQLLLFHEALQKDQQQAEAEEEKITVKGHARKRNGRALIPDHLPREVVVHDLTEEERACPGCQQQRLRIGEEVTEVLEYAPATMKAIVHKRCKYACPECSGHFVTAQVPNEPFERSKAGPGLLAAVAVGKYADHLPLYRQEGIFKRFGVTIPRSTQSDWMRRTAEVLDPLAKRITQRIRTSAIIQSDDTPVRLRDGPKKGIDTARFWSYVGDCSNPYVAYEFTPNRRGQHPQHWLANCDGYLQTDAFAGYQKLFEKNDENKEPMTAVACWAHVRRKFFDARISHSRESMEILALIGKLYAIERKARDDADTKNEPSGKRRPAFPAAAARKALRRARAPPTREQIFTMLTLWQPTEPPKSSLGKAIGYALKLEPALQRYLDDGAIEIDNNACERSVRGIALGRKNWLFAGSAAGGRTAATLFTVIGSARLHEIEPWAYLYDLLNRMPHAPMSTLDDFLPDRWAAQHPKARLPLNR